MLVVSVNSETGEVLMFSFPRDLQRFPLYNGGTYSGKLNTFAGVSQAVPRSVPGRRACRRWPTRSATCSASRSTTTPASTCRASRRSSTRSAASPSTTNARSHDDHLAVLPVGRASIGSTRPTRCATSAAGKAGGGDFGRAERQQQVLAALRKEMLKPENLPRLPDIVEALSHVINTDFPPDQIDRAARRLPRQVEDEPSQSWVFKDPEWARPDAASETGLKRPVLRAQPRQRSASCRIELFGEKSLWTAE